MTGVAQSTTARRGKPGRQRRKAAAPSRGTRSDLIPAPPSSNAAHAHPNPVAPRRRPPLPASLPTWRPCGGRYRYSSSSPSARRAANTTSPLHPTAPRTTNRRASQPPPPPHRAWRHLDQGSGQGQDKFAPASVLPGASAARARLASPRIRMPAAYPVHADGSCSSPPRRKRSCATPQLCEREASEPQTPALSEFSAPSGVVHPSPSCDHSWPGVLDFSRMLRRRRR
jgi:hypothetical protein